MTRASLTASTGGESMRTMSASSRNEPNTSRARREARSSDGLGGMGPDAST